MKIFRLFSMAALALVTAACSSNDNEIEQQPAQQARMHFSATIAAPNSGTVTRTTYAETGDGKISVAWKVGDKIALVHNSVKDVATVTAVDGSGKATISGSLTVDPGNGDDVALVYPAAAVGTADGGTAYTLDDAFLAKRFSQDGTLAYIQNNLDLRTVNGSFSVSGSDVTLSGSPVLASKIAIWKLRLQNTSSEDINPTSVTITAGGNPVATAASPGRSEYYLCVPELETSAGALSISAATSTNYYTYTKATGVNLAKNTYYQSTVAMTSMDDPMLAVPLTLEAKTAGTIRILNPPTGMKYSKNSGTKMTVPDSDIDVVAGETLELYGNGTSITSYYSTRITSGTADCYIYGNVMSLVDEADFANATTLTGYNAFRRLFDGNTHLYNHPTKRLVLPATTLKDYCYRDMFYGCTHLTAAPTLPATTMADACYHQMFRGCTSLTAAPALPATTLAKNCYSYMFVGCTSLTTAPATLPAKTLTEGCYWYMFHDCTSLTVAPELPAKTLANKCYSNMFEDCTSLTTAPATLPATTLAEGCYACMFECCTKLTAAPALPATSLANTCYYSMFAGCTSLTTAPVLPATTLAETCYFAMFSGCSSLNAVTCLATDMSAEYATYMWLDGVAATGTFTKASGAGWTTSESGIPSGWTVTDY